MPQRDSCQFDFRYVRLCAWFSHYSFVLVTFSAGCDSTLVLKAAIDSRGPENVIACTGDSPAFPREDLKQSKEYVSLFGATQLIIQTKELDNDNYRENLGRRCYFCKQELFIALRKQLEEERAAGNLLAKRALQPQAVWVDGVNLDDLDDIRPGQKAAQEAGVRHPLLETELTKSDVRELSRYLDLPTWDKPASACLASRIAPGETVNKEKLVLVEKAEKRLRELGFSSLRVRLHQVCSCPGKGATYLARIELDQSEVTRTADLAIRNQIVERCLEAGFSYVTLDLAGYRLGGFALNREVQ